MLTVVVVVVEQEGDGNQILMSTKAEKDTALPHFTFYHISFALSSDPSNPNGKNQAQFPWSQNFQNSFNGEKRNLKKKHPSYCELLPPASLHKKIGNTVANNGHAWWGATSAGYIWQTCILLSSKAVRAVIR